jgi:hypothetical protein
MKKFLALAALVTLFAAATASAASYEGKWGFSLNSSSTPVGLTFGVGKATAVDVGVGFSKPKDVDLGIAVSAGLRQCLVESDNANAFVRFSGLYSQYPTSYNPVSNAARSDAATTDVPKLKTFGVGVQLGGEWWPSSVISVYIRHGVEFTSSKVGDGESSSTFQTTGETLGQAGFTLWWGGKK